MTTPRTWEFWQSYRYLVKQILASSITEENRRTGENIKALMGHSFSVDLRSGILPTCGVRKTRPHIAAAEFAWCVRGERSIEWLAKHTKVWNDFADVEQCSLCLGTGVLGSACLTCAHCEGRGGSRVVDAAYGFRWRTAFGRDQLMLAIAALRRDMSDRRIWISSWDPREDGLGAENQKTVPCPVGFTLAVLGDELISTFVIRSSDVFMGLPYDIMRHAYLMAAVATSLSVRLGIMQVSIAHPHLYARHWDLSNEMVNGPHDVVVPQIILPRWPVEQIDEDPDEYVRRAKTKADDVVWPAFSPLGLEVVR